LLFHTSRPFSSRIVGRTNLEALQRDHMAASLAHHLKIAGGKEELFSDEAITAIHQSSGGLLRRAGSFARGALLAAAPMFLKNVARVDAFLFLEYVALTVLALVEREARQAMQQQGVKKLALYPEEREFEAPTAARVFEVFAPLQRHELSKGGKVAQVFLREMTVQQKKILKLLGIPVTRYRRDLE
jgi:hypothetical protein